MSGEELKYKKWRKSICNLLAVFASSVFLVEFVFYFFYYKGHPERVGNLSEPKYLLYFLIGPTLLYLSIVLFSQFVEHSKKLTENFKNWSIIICLSCFCGTVMIIHYVFPPLLCVCVFPIIMSTIFDRNRLTYITYGIAIVSLLCSFLQAQNWFIFPGMGGYFKDIDANIPYNYIIAFIALTFGFFLSIVLMSFYREKRKAIEESYNKQIELHEQLKLDSLTRLYNHTAIHDILKQQVDNYDPSSELILSIIDIDNFKKFNDNYGHMMGDSVIVALARFINEYCNTNVYGARYGGEEFAILFVGYQLDEVKLILRQIQNQLHKVQLGLPPKEHITVSCGISVYNTEMSNYNEFFKRADDATYLAKANGKNCIIVAEKN